MFLGIDVGGTKIEAAYGDESRVDLLYRLSTPGEYDCLLQALKSIVDTIRGDGKAVEIIAIGLPGQVEDGAAVWVPNLPYLDGKNIATDFAVVAGAYVVVANDAQLSLLGEAWRGVAVGRCHALLFSIGTGVGGALLVAGRVFRGAHGSAGSMGWLNLDLSETPDPDHGFLERHCSGTALERLGQSLSPPRSAKQVVVEARLGDPASIALIEQFAYKLGAGAASVASVFDPELIIFSGGLVDAFDVLKPAMGLSFFAHASPGTRSIPLVPGGLGAHAGAYGALRAAMLKGDIWL